MRTVALGVALALLAIGAPAQAQQLQPGLYEANAKMEMKGMPVNMPPQTNTMRFCLTEEQLSKDPSETFNREADGKCAMDDFEMAGGKISYTMTCDGPQGKMVGRSTGTYTSNSYTLTSDMTMSAGGQQMTMRTSQTANRVGECKNGG